jgi:hypothetical protein
LKVSFKSTCLGLTFGHTTTHTLHAMRYWACLLLLLLAGCGSSGPFEYKRASGKITYDDGTPLPAGFKLLFIAQNVAPINGAIPRAAEAVVNNQGEFPCVTSYKYGDGLIPGKHKVVIQPERSQTNRSMVPKEYSYSETTPLIVDTDEAPFDIKVPKPKGAGSR